MTALAFAPNGVFKPSLSNVIEEWFGNDSISRSGMYSPPTNIIHTEDSYIIKLSVPGYSKEAFDIKVERDQLMISTPTPESDTAENESYKMKEFSPIAFKKSFNISNDINIENITAKYENGILSVVLPKKDEAKPLPPRSINID